MTLASSANRELPIGVFDSGLGGLTIVKAMQAIMPDEGVIYFGDTAHLPYGDKSPELINEYSANITDFLVEKGVKAIVIACNTASAVAQETVKKHAGEIPVFNVIGPAVRMAIGLSEQNNIGVIGTKTTVRSGVYKKSILANAADAKVVEKATPLLVPLIEEGWLNNTVSKEVIEAYMSDTGFESVDTLILGCTHYPLIMEDIQDYFHNDRESHVHVVDSSIALAAEVNKFLQDQEMSRTGQEELINEYFVSDYSQNFEESGRLFLEKSVEFLKSPIH